MATKLASSELILNDRGGIYHCNIRPEELADTVILVGDPDRVPKVSKHFDSIDVKSQKREIVVHTGTKNGKRISVISTGMGPDNIDIVLNELDALANIDFEKKEIKSEFKQLTFVRLGTSGALQADIPVDSFVAGSHGIGFDGLMSFYAGTESIYNNELTRAFNSQVEWDSNRATPYIVEGSQELLSLMTEGADNVHTGITGTAIGFYGPQGRILRIESNDEDMHSKLTGFKHNNHRITNFEMETSAIYGLSKLMGHRALSFNTIIANRLAGTFSKDPYASVEKMIEYAVERLSK